MEELKWYEKIKYQCPKCGEYGVFKYARENKTHYQKECTMCGFTLDKEIVFAEYRQIGEKVFLRSNKYREFTEVELVKNKKGQLKVMPVSNKQSLWTTKMIGEGD